MSGPRATDELLARLVQDLAPVRIVAPLRRQLLALVGVLALTAAGVAAWLGLQPAAVLARGGVSAGLTAALIGVGGGALGLALSASVPGRETLARLAGAVAAAGGLVVLALAIAARGASVGASIPQDVLCSGRALLLALPCAALAFWQVWRGAPWRPWITALAAALGAVGSGGLLVHLSCPSPSPWHWLLAHALVPLGVGATIGGVAALLLRVRFARVGRPQA